MVEGARLESVYTPKAYRGFESHLLRQLPGIMSQLNHGNTGLRFERFAQATLAVVANGADCHLNEVDVVDVAIGQFNSRLWVICSEDNEVAVGTQNR